MADRLKIKAASFILFKQENKILLLRRFNTGWKDGHYTFPAGHVDPGEVPSQAAIRECMEEVGLIIPKDKLKFIHAIFRVDDYADYFFLAEAWSGELINGDPEKCDDVAWFELDDLPENILENVKVILEGLKAGNYYSEVAVNPN